MTDTVLTRMTRQSDGNWVHTGRLTVSRILTNGVRVSVTLPDDFAALSIADGSITSAKIADGTIQAVDIANGAVTAAKLGSDVHPTSSEWSALLARVSALEARPLINSLDDLVYGPF
jgi:hypothetical protein